MMQQYIKWYDIIINKLKCIPIKIVHIAKSIPSVALISAIIIFNSN